MTRLIAITLILLLMTGLLGCAGSAHDITANITAAAAATVETTIPTAPPVSEIIPPTIAVQTTLPTEPKHSEFYIFPPLFIFCCNIYPYLLINC